VATDDSKPKKKRRKLRKETYSYFIYKGACGHVDFGVKLT
jgi:hypothetical protein